MSTRKLEGQVDTWEEPIGILRASFCQGTSEVRKAIGHVPATLIIGGKGYTEEEVKAMVKEMIEAVSAGEEFTQESIAAKHGITL